MTTLPPPSKVKLGLVIDLDTCVGCHACAVGCKEWNAGGIAGPLIDEHPYGKDPSGVWFNRVHSYEVQGEGRRETGDGSSGCSGSSLSSPVSPFPPPAMTLHFPRSCLHCETPACVTVCPTGASYKRAQDGIVLVDEDKCIGCGLCAWACPYGAREFSPVEGVMKKCTLCVDRIYNQNLPEAEREPACVQVCPTRARHFGDLGDPESKVSKLVAERGGVALLPELGYQPVNRYLPPRPRRNGNDSPPPQPSPASGGGSDEVTAQRWLDRILKR